MRIAGAILFLVLSFAARAEEPEAVYARFHRAIASANFEEIMRYSPAARRAEMAAMSPAQKEAQLKMFSMMLPRGFTLMSKTVAPNGRRARLFVTGPGEPMMTGTLPQTMYGDVKMVNEGGEWKVEDLAWSNEKPAAASQARPQAPAARQAGKSGPARTDALAPETPVRKLGTAKQECVYKPVMTAEDMERCR